MKIKFGQISWEDLKIIFIAYLALILLIESPYVYALLNTPKDYVFTWITNVNTIDINSYLSLMKQAADGEILFEEKYSFESHNRLMFRPLDLLLGWVSSLSGLTVGETFHIAKLPLIFLLLVVLYLFVSEFLKDKRAKTIAFTIAVFCSGLGFLSLFNGAPRTAYDFWVPEMYVFLSSYTSPLFVLSLALILGILILLKRGLEGKPHNSAYAGGLSLILGVIHPYDIILIWSILLLYIICLSAKFKPSLGFSLGFALRSLRICLPFLLLSSLPILYYYYIFTHDVVLSGWLAQNYCPTYPWEMVVGIGIAGLLALIYLIRGVFQCGTVPLLITCWVVSGVSLSFSPLGFQRRMVMGLMIPIGILVAMEIRGWWQRFDRRSLYVLLAPVCTLLFATNTLTLYDAIDRLGHPDYPNYLHKDYFAAFDWLDRNTDKTDLVLSSPHIGNFIPAYARNNVFAGHPGESINYHKKLEMVAEFFNKNTPASRCEEILGESNINFVLYGPIEKELGFRDPGAFDFLRPVYNSTKVSIYEVQ